MKYLITVVAFISISGADYKLTYGDELGKVRNCDESL